jgi:hypothetical protein
MLSRFALGLVVAGLLTNLLLVLLLLADAALPGQLSLGVAAVLAALSGLALVGGLVMLEPWRGTAGTS